MTLAAFWAGWEPVFEDKESAKAVRKGKTFSIHQEMRYVLYSLEVRRAGRCQLVGVAGLRMGRRVRAHAQLPVAR
jgi:hypothetical protein